MKERGKRIKMISVRASEEEIARVKALAAEVIKIYPYVKEADVLRELLGLIDTGIITKEMRAKLCSAPLEPTTEKIALDIRQVSEINRLLGNLPPERLDEIIAEIKAIHAQVTNAEDLPQDFDEASGIKVIGRKSKKS